MSVLFPFSSLLRSISWFTFACEEIEVEIYADVDGRDVSLTLVSAGANETIEEYKNKVIDEQIEAIKGIAPDIVIIEI